MDTCTKSCALHDKPLHCPIPLAPSPRLCDEDGELLARGVQIEGWLLSLKEGQTATIWRGRLEESLDPGLHISALRQEELPVPRPLLAPKMQHSCLYAK